jgi:hypothetical protein
MTALAWIFFVSVPAAWLICLICGASAMFRELNANEEIGR